MKRRVLTCLGVALVCLASCKRDEEIKVYKVEKPAVPGDPASHSMAGGRTADSTMPAGDPHAGVPGAPPTGGGTADPHAGLSPEQLSAAAGSPGAGPQVTDDPPDHWQQQPKTALRQASYRVTGEGGAKLDISLVILRGAAGGALDNVNRWRSQLGQEPIDQAQLDEIGTKLATPAGEAVAVDIVGLPDGADPLKDGRLIGAVASHQGNAWFYKLRGNADLATKEKDNFLRWITTVKPAAGESAKESATDPAAAAPLDPPSTAVPGTTPSAAEPKHGPTWQLPADWKEVAGSSARYATLAIAGADGTKAELAVTSFPGDVGGDLDNVNRWRQQVGVAAVSEAELPSLVTKVAAGELTISMIDVTGQQSRLLAGWVRHGPNSWFFKLTGPDDLLEKEREKFAAFLASVRFTEEKR